MAKPQPPAKVCDFEPPPCRSCPLWNERLIESRRKEEETQRELKRHLDIKDKEKDFLRKINALDKQIHDLQATLVMKQNSCSGYISEIDALKKQNNNLIHDFNEMKIKYDTLELKVASYTSAAHLIETGPLVLSPQNKKSKSFIGVRPPYSFEHIPDTKIQGEHCVIPTVIPESSDKGTECVELGPMPPPPVPLEETKSVQRKPKVFRSILS